MDEDLTTRLHREIADDFLSRLKGIRGITVFRHGAHSASFFITGMRRNLWCRFFPFTEDFLTVSARIPLLMQEVPRTKDLLERMLDLNAGLGLGAVVLDPDNRLVLDYTFFVNSISARDTMAIIALMEQAADKLSEELSRLTGAMPAID
jgi:hypothetical protein